MKKVVFLVSLTAILLGACKSDINLLAPYKEQMVIYGLLNQADSVQYIRINKTFLGQGNAYNMATIHDSINYTNLLNVSVQQWQNGAFVSSCRVDTTSMLVQDPGAFANQPQILYRVHTGGVNALNPASQYSLTVTNPKTGYTATGLTSLVAFSAADMGFAPPSAYKFYNTNTATPERLKWTSDLNGRVYDLVMRFHYTEYAISGTTSKYVDLDFGNSITSGLSGGEPMEADENWVQFEHFLASSIPNDPTVYKRVMGLCELMLYVGGDEFYTYQQVNEPVSSITGDKPTYSNITNGVGLFSARYLFDVPSYNKPIENNTLDQLAQDTLTCPLHIADHIGNVAAACP